MSDGLRGVGGVDPIYPKHSRESERDRQERRGRDSRGREWTEQEEDEGHLGEQFQEKAAPILPTTPRRKIRATVEKREESFPWTGEQLQHLSIREKVGQTLFLVVNGAFDPSELIELVSEFSVGGLFFSQLKGNLEEHRALIEQLQAVANRPLLIGTVWGSGSHFEGIERLPLPSTIGQIGDPDLLREAGQMIGETYRRLGFHALLVSLVEAIPSLVEQVGPDAFLSDDRETALSRGIALMGGMGLIPVPQTCIEGEAEEEGDWLIHQLLHPLSSLGYEQIRPFRKMAQAGLERALFPHLAFPILVGERPGEEFHPDLALLFGHLLRGGGDWRERMLVGREGAEQVMELLLAAVSDGAITRAELDGRVESILRAKERAGFSSEQADLAQLNRDALDELHRKLYGYAFTLRINDPEALPLTEHFGLIEVDAPGTTHFSQLLKNRAEPLCISTTPYYLESRSVEEEIVEQLHEQRVVVVAVYKERSLSSHLFELLHRLRALNKKVILVAFLPFCLLKGVGRESAYLVVNEDLPAAQIAAAQRLFRP